jgi:hypothetical protein
MSKQKAATSLMIHFTEEAYQARNADMIDTNKQYGIMKSCSISGRRTDGWLRE